MVYSLTDVEKRQCAKYVYSETNASIHERLMKPIWTKLELYIPDYICATTLTTFGLIANLIPCVILMMSSPSADETVPSWLLLWGCLGMFTHQNLDNMDGKHARRFGVENTITDFFDHSADTIAAGITVINISIATKLGNFQEWMIVLLVVFLVVFYSYHWRVYISEVVKFGQFDVTETQDVAMMFVLVSAIFGQDIWSVNIHVIGNAIDVRKVCLILACVGGGLKISENVLSVYRGTCKTTTRSKISQAFFPGIPIVFVLICVCIACYGNPDLYLQHPLLLAATLTIVFAKPILEIMVVHFTHSLMATLTLNEVAMVLFALNACVSFVDSKTSLIMLLVLCCLDVGIYFYRIASDMHECMGFQWFRLTLKGRTTRTEQNNNQFDSLKKSQNFRIGRDTKTQQTNMKYLIQY